MLQPPVLKIDNQEIDNVKTFNYLGIVINSNLTWKDHIQYIGTKIAKTTAIMTKLKHFLPESALFNIYSSLIHCHFTYGVLVWGSHVGQLVRLQKKAIRIVCGAARAAHTEPMFKRLNVLKVSDIRHLHELKFYYNIVKESVPSYFLSEFIIHCDINHEYLTRFGTRLLYPRFRHEYFRSCLRYSICKTINSTEETTIQMIYTHSLNGFKQHIKRYIISQYQTNCLRLNCFACNSAV